MFSTTVGSKGVVEEKPGNDHQGEDFHEKIETVFGNRAGHELEKPVHIAPGVILRRVNAVVEYSMLILEEKVGLEDIFGRVQKRDYFERPKHVLGED